MTPRTKQINVRLDIELIERVQRMNNDPTRNRARYGSMTELITYLLWKHVHNHTRQQQEDPNDPNAPSNNRNDPNATDGSPGPISLA